jgi:hypothetical protein
MSRLLVLVSLPFFAAGVGRAAAPPLPTEKPLAALPLLDIREVEQPCGAGIILAPATSPETHPALFLHRPTIPCRQTVIVHRTQQHKQLRLVYRRVSHPVTVEVIVPTTLSIKKPRLVYRREVRRELRPRLVYLKTTRPEQRLVYRPIERRVPCTRDVYVPIVKREKRLRLVYLSEPVSVTHTVPRVRMQDVTVDDPVTGRPCKTKQPVCEQVQTTETVRRITPTIRPVEESVTSYRLERRTEMRKITDYVLQLMTENVTRYHAETRLVPERVVCYLPHVELDEETVKHYHCEPRAIIKHDYVPEWREVEETVHTYHLETRWVMRPAEQPVVYHGETIVPVTRLLPLAVTFSRRVPQVEPLAAPGCGAGISGGFVSFGPAQ